MTASELLKAVNDNLGYIVGIYGSLAVLFGWVIKLLRDISKRIKALDTDMADILCTQLTSEHDRYMHLGWCSASDKRRLEEIYHRYKSRGRNHIATHYIEDIAALSEHPPEKV